MEEIKIHTAGDSSVLIDYGALKERLEKLLKLEVSQETAPSRIFDIPVCYGGE